VNLFSTCHTRLNRSGNSPQLFNTLSGKNALMFVFIQIMLLTNLTCI
jgi:hypothetical protein